MRVDGRGRACFAVALALALVAGGRAEQGTTPAEPVDPRVGLKPGQRDAGVAARHMELVASLPMPDGFVAPPAAAASVREDLNFANSDLAFGADHLFSGSFHGFNVYTIEDPTRPRLLASIVCPGGQGDVSIHGRLLFMSVEQTRGRLDCGTGGVHGLASGERFRGVRIFDVSDVRSPKQLAAIQTCRGSHTHTLVVDPRDSANVYIYGSGTGLVRSADELAGCSRMKPDEDPDTALGSIDVIQVPLAAPETARIVNRPRIFADSKSGAILGLWQGGDHGPATQTTSVTNHCHDITVMPAVGLAVGACSGNGILLDISDPVHPVRLDQVTDQNFAYWHSATFNNDGTKVIFTDEWGGGTQPRCRSSDNLAWGADAIFEVVDRKLRFGGYFKMPAPQTAQENCVAHNGSIVPVPGRDIMVQAWYQGGISVFDFTDAAQPVEIAFFDRGPFDGDRLVTAGYWSAYWRNGYVYGAEIARGLDVFRLTPSEHLTRNEIEAAALVSPAEFNPQHQPRFEWPAATVVARAYLDQLGRSRAVAPRRAEQVRSALDRVDRLSTGPIRDATKFRNELNGLATQLERDATALGDVDAARARALAATLRGRASAIVPR